MTEPANGASSGWTVTAQTETKQMPPGAQNYVDGFKVTFVTGRQVVGSVFVPSTDLNPATVKAAIDARAAQLDAISNLTGAGS